VLKQNNFKQKVYLLFLLLGFMLLQACTEDEQVMPPEDALSPAAAYLLTVALGSEFGSNAKAVRKWSKNMKVFLSDTVDLELRTEFEHIRQEINALSSSFQIDTVGNIQEANFVIFLSSADTYAAYESSAASLLNSNFGLVWIYWNNQDEITRGSMYVDIFRTKELDCQKHLLREEFTQGLGLLNDSYDYPESIFYQAYTCLPTYATIDTELLKIFLDARIQAGMTRAQLLEALLEF